MSDIVERLRDYARNCGGPPEEYLTWQAADEIERLRALVKDLADDLEAELNGYKPRKNNSNPRKSVWDFTDIASMDDLEAKLKEELGHEDAQNFMKLVRPEERLKEKS